VTSKARQSGPEFIVTSTGDSPNGTSCFIDSCTLRGALYSINLHQVSGTVKFNLTGVAPHRIRLTDELPVVEYPVTIDGWSQPGWTHEPIIWIDGDDIASTIILEGGNSTVQGLVIADFYRHNYVNEYALIVKGENNAIYGNYIGIDPTGTIVMSNRRGLDAHNAQIGGPLPHQGNVVTGNTLGGIHALNSTIQNNIVGLDPTGAFTLGSQRYGITGLNNFVGGSGLNEGNLVSGQTYTGISVGDGSIVRGNLVGTDSLMTVSIPNRTGIGAGDSIVGGDGINDFNIVMGNQTGIVTSDSEVIGNYIGIDNTGTIQIPNDYGMGSGSGSVVVINENNFRNNVVVGNLYDGISLGQGGNRLYGNYIGVTRDLTPIPNGGSGIYLNSDSLYPNFVGGYDYGQPNFIAHNGGAGIASETPQSAWIKRNVIFNNDGLAVDHLNDGIINRDPTDDMPDAPTIFDVRYNGSSIQILGEFAADELQEPPYLFDVYHNASCDPLGNGEAENYVGQAVVNTTEHGYVGFDITLPYSGDMSDVITVLVINTRYINSSEMSNCADILQDSLPAPSNLMATPIDDDSVQIDWVDNSSDESSFVLETSINRETWFTEATLSANITQAIVNDLTCGTTHYFRVRAVRSSDSAESANSAHASYTTPDCVIPVDGYLDVTTTSDTYDGICDADCSLRDAITASNNASGTQVINVISGIINISSLVDDDDDVNVIGDFDITDDVHIIGDGIDTTTIHIGGEYWAFHIHGDAELRLNDLTITKSDSDYHTIVNLAGVLRATNVKIQEAATNTGSGGYHVYNGGEAYLNYVEISQELNQYSGSRGFYNSGYVEINYAYIHHNYKVLRLYGGIAKISNSLIVDNHEDRGHGELISLAPDAEALTIDHTTFSNNDSAGIFQFYSTPAILRARNSIFDATWGQYYNVCENGGKIVNIGTNLYSDASCGSIDLGLGEAVVVDSVILDENYQPDIGSPAIDAAIGDCPTHDFYGISRPIGGACDIGAIESIYTPMDPPTNLAGTVVNNLNIDLTWLDNASYEASYVVERSVDNVTWSEIATLSADSEAYSDTDTLNCFTDYYYRVSSRIGIASATSSIYQIRTGCTPIVAPSNLDTTAIVDAVDLTWQDNSQTENGFNILRRVSGNLTWQTVDVVGQSTITYRDVSVSCETAYEYQIEAYRDEDSTSDVSNIDSVMTYICPVSVPISFTSTGNTEVTIDLSWVDTATNETAFELYKLGEPLELIATLPSDTQTTTVYDLACDTAYQYSIQAYREIDGLRRDSDSMELTATTARCKVQSPSNPAPMAVQRNTVEIMWEDTSPEETTHFIIERAIEENTGEVQAQAIVLNWNHIAQIPVGNTSYTDDDLVCGTSYWYRVQGYDQVFKDYSDYSDPIQVITSECPVPVTNTIGLYQEGIWIFRAGFENSTPAVTFRYGPQEYGWIPLTGDWDGNGIDGIGLYKDGVFALRDVSERGVSDYVYRFGDQKGGAQPIVGDWNGDGQDTVGLYRDGVFILTNSHETPTIDHQFVFGKRESGWTAITGDWIGTGRDLVGLYKDGVFQLHNSFKTQSSGQFFRFGPDSGDWIPITGDWDADSSTTIGLYKESSWRLRNNNSRGQVDIGFIFGNLGSSAYPLASYRGGEEAIEALAFVSSMPLPDINASLNNQEAESPSPTPTEPVLVTVSATEETLTPTVSISGTNSQVELTVTPTSVQEPTASPTLATAPRVEGDETAIPTMTATPTPTETIEQTITPTLTPVPSVTPLPTNSPTAIQVPSEATVEESEPEVTKEVIDG
jgi:CSLREA domain-containing protein